MLTRIKTLMKIFLWNCIVNRQHVNQTTAEAEFLDVTGQQAYEFSSLLFTVTYTNGFYSPPPPT